MRIFQDLSLEDQDFYAWLPKVHLHSHLLGMVAAETVLELANRHGLDLGAEDPRRLFSYFDFGGFTDILSKVASVIRHENDFSRVIYEAIKNGYEVDRVLYAELFIQPTYHLLFGVDYPTMIAGLSDGIERARRDFDVDTRLILGLNRQLPPQIATHIVRQAIAHPSPCVIGIGLEDYEPFGAPDAFTQAYRLAEAAGLHRTAHAGEHGPAENVVKALTALNCERIDHGYQVVTNPSIAYRLAEANVHFTTCPTVAGRQGWARPEGHVLKLMRDAGLWISINADDPAIIKTSLSREYEIAAKAMNVSRYDMAELSVRTIDASWLSMSEKQTLTKRFKAELNDMSQLIDHSIV